MTTTRSIHSYFLCIAVTLGVFCLGRPALAGSIVEVKNTDKDLNSVLSDLIVYGENDQKNTILKLNDASDDITLAPNGVRTFDAGFEVKKYFVSITIPGFGEIESIVLKVSQRGPDKLGFFSDFDTGLPLVAALDYELSVPPPAEGTIIEFTNGTSPLLPGWFMGTGADFDAGEVTGAFTGQGQVIDNALEVAAIPEPCSMALLGLGALGSWGLTRHRRRASVA